MMTEVKFIKDVKVISGNAAIRWILYLQFFKFCILKYRDEQ